MNNNQLSFKQFQQKHQAKYVNLTPTQVRERYDQYLAQLSVKKQIIAVRKSPPKPLPRTPRNTQVIRQRLRKNPMPKQTKISLSECLLKYAIASIDPFDENLSEVCIPDTLCTPSYKYDVLCKGTMTVGTQGVGFIAFNPWTMATSNNGFNIDGADYPIIYTTATYPDGDISIDNVLLTNGDLAGANSNSFFDTNTFRPTTSIHPRLRLVAAGVQCMYSGQLLNQSGTINTLQNDGLAPLFDPMTVIQVKNNPKTRTCSNAKDQRCYQSYYPTSEEFISYQDIEHFMPSQLNETTVVFPYNNNPILILVDGATAGTTFAFEARAFFEVLLPGMKASPSDADPIGFSAFQAARTKLKNTGDPRADTKTTLQDTLKIIGTSISGIAPAVGTAIGTVFGNPLAGGAIGTAAQGLLNSLLGNSPSPY